MIDFILANEREIYSVSYFLALTAVALWEMAAPRRALTQSLKRRWTGNFAITILDIIVIRLVFPMAAVGMALLAEDWRFGLFNNIDAPFWIAAAVSILAIDFARYLQHFLLHHWSPLWRLHRVHHADLDYDFTVGLRFHPLEGLYSMGFVVAAVILVGAPPVVVALMEAATAISGVFVHANARLPQGLDRLLRTVIVTPDMHRVHHSTVRIEQDSNYGAVFPFWDKLMRTYRPQPAAGHQGMTIGLPDMRDEKCLGLSWMLTAPFLPQPPTSRSAEGAS